ncbi:hypothetical protein BD310DRAFT_980441 [Dichomitus squalens]|uniref:Uncharacterized protein n=1 Tax=Dichomitus squalens TaxID=114155 RepID=A0A4Q9PJS6_9APHY|nr:hypothetical protein BD310DRAFT_980441 [Dichomitus squalens]
MDVSTRDGKIRCPLCFPRIHYHRLFHLVPTVDTDSDNDAEDVPPDGNGDEHGSDVDAPAPICARNDTAPEATSSLDTANENNGKYQREESGKAKGKLADVPAKKELVKKLTTLDKSAMDWRAHVQGGVSAKLGADTVPPCKSVQMPAAPFRDRRQRVRVAHSATRVPALAR